MYGCYILQPQTTASIYFPLRISTPEGIIIITTFSGPAATRRLYSTRTYTYTY